MQAPQFLEQNLQIVDLDPSRLLQGETPRLIAEQQLAPKLWDAIRFEVDKRDEFAQFVLTESAVPADFSKISHSGIGRIARLRMRPMSLYESRDSNGMVSLKSVFSQNSYTLDGVNTANIDTSRMKHPSFKMIVTGTGKYAYEHPDGVLVVPIGCLKQ